MLSPEIWESASFSSLSDLAKIVFVSLISHADDEGRGIANPSYIKSLTFPYDENKRVADVKSALSEIARCTSTQFYSVNGIEYFFMTTWKRWQKIDKPTKSKLPPPPDAGVGGDMPSMRVFGENSANTPRTVGEDSETNRRRIEEKRIESNVVDDEDISKMLKNVVVDCKPVYSHDEYIKAMNALKNSKWARENLTHLSKIHRVWEKLISGFYRDRNDSPNVYMQQDYSADELNTAFAKLNEEL